MIELKHFISQTLIEIVEGVVEAQTAVDKHGAKVSPLQAKIHGYEPRAESVAFDIEVTTADSTTSKKGMGVFVAPIAVGTQGVTDAQRTSVGRIQFHVWVQLPAPG
jgi:hypothetical protein